MKLKKYRYRIAFSASLVCIVGILTMLSSCQKGDTGPAGPVGAQGDSGINGSANIITAIYTVATTYKPGDTVSSWVSKGSPTYHWVAGFIDTNMAGYNVDVVEAYWATALATGWSALPVTSLINQGDEMNFRYSYDSVSFTYYTGGGSFSKYPGYPANSPAYNTIYFKLVIIPPSLQLANPGINWKNASEVAALPAVEAALRRQ